MKTRLNTKWAAVIVFYVIAVILRALALQLEVPGVADLKYFLVDWAGGAGPCIGALGEMVPWCAA